MDNEAINKSLETLALSNLEDVKQNLRSFRYQNNEVPHVRKWIQEQELMPPQYPTTEKSKSTNDWHNMPLGKIAITVIGGILVLALAWIINHYLHLKL